MWWGAEESRLGSTTVDSVGDQIKGQSVSLADEIDYGRACKGGSIGSLVVYVQNNKRKMICETFTFLALNE